MNTIDEIRAKLEANDILSAGAIDEVIRIIAPYLSHGITDEEARTWFNELPYNLNQLEFMIEGKNLGLITSSREPIAEPEESLCANCARKGVDCKGFLEKVIDCPNRIQKE